MRTQDNKSPNDASAPLSDIDFERISKIAKSGWGLNLDSAKKPLIKSRLSGRLKELGLSGFDDYCKRVEAGDPVEADHFVTALTTNVTHFYREAHHFDHLEAEILPELIARAKRGERVRIWSAGCSTGQEPYCLAGSILKTDSTAGNLDIRILATDIDSKVLQKASDGRYKAADCRFPTPEHQSRIFPKDTNAAGEYVVRPEISKFVTFRHLNLVQDWPMSGQLDVIMCRNVAIYFDRETQTRLWTRFVEKLVDGGHLYIGHSERVIDPNSLGLKAVGTTTYCRPNPKHAA